MSSHLPAYEKLSVRGDAEESNWRRRTSREAAGTLLQCVIDLFYNRRREYN
jgi:hypothetical protein